jgi:holo-[acyl-carrier protein] synthase
MISGIGIDIAEVGRIRDSFARFGARFQRRVFTDSEIAFCETLGDKFPSYAGRFAAKEAVSKALGTGLRGPVGWKDIQINDNERSRPTVSVFGWAARLLGSRRIHLSISHTRELATAVAIIEEG